MVKVLCLIPARGGSKSIPRKNIREFKGIPLIAHTIRQSLSSAWINRTIVSTEDAEIASISRTHGAEVITRPMELALDDTPDYPVFKHALEWLAQESYYPDIIVHLRCTTPNRLKSTMDRAISFFISEKLDSLRSIRPAHFSPYKMVLRNPNGMIHPVIGEPLYWNAPRQSLPQAYEGDGTIDITRPHIILEQGRMLAENTFGFLIEDWAIDIDTALDFERASRL